MTKTSPQNWSELVADYACGTWLGEFIEIPNLQKRFRGKIQGLEILDVGCGYGKHSHFFCEEGAKVTGIDASEEMIVASKKLAPHADFHFASATDLSILENKKFDLIFAIFLFPNIQTVEEFQKCCKEMRAHLKTSGRIIIYDRHPLAFRNTDSALTKVMIPAVTEENQNGCKFEVHIRLKNNGWIRFFNYHWTLEHWQSQLQQAGFVMRTFIQPKPITPPSELAQEFAPFYKQPLHMLLELEAS